MNEKEFKEGAKIIKSATKFSKKLPFYYAALFLLLMCGYLFCGEKVSKFLDITFYVSPFVALLSLRLSCIFKFCKWHRIECLLPLIPYAFNIIDTIRPFNEYGSIINFIMLFVILVATIVNAYFVFRRAR